MITEDYVSFETAKLLKEKGFEGRMHTFYTEEGTEIESSYVVPSNFFPIYRPTFQMATKWLREKHNLHIVVDWHYDTDPSETNDYSISYMYVISSWNSPKEHFEETSYKTCEQALEAAIKYCLKNLI